MHMKVERELERSNADIQIHRKEGEEMRGEGGARRSLVDSHHGMEAGG